jgi:hypothetical protein
METMSKIALCAVVALAAVKALSRLKIRPTARR